MHCSFSPLLKPSPSNIQSLKPCDSNFYYKMLLPEIWSLWDGEGMGEERTKRPKCGSHCSCWSKWSILVVVLLLFSFLYCNKSQFFPKDLVNIVYNLFIHPFNIESLKCFKNYSGRLWCVSEMTCYKNVVLHIIPAFLHKSFFFIYFSPWKLYVVASLELLQTVWLLFFSATTYLSSNMPHRQSTLHYHWVAKK